MKKNQQRNAFSIIEIGIVVLIIGVLIVGVISAATLIKSAKINGYRHFTNNSVVMKTEGLIAWYETSLKQSFVESEALSSTKQISKWNDINPSSVVNNRNILTSSNSVNTIIREDNNSQLGVRFDGSANFTLANFFQGELSSATFFLVIKPSSLSGTSTITDSFGSNLTYSLSINSSSVILNAGNSVQTSGVNPASFIAEGKYIICATFNSDSSRVYINDANLLTGGSALNVGNNTLAGITIGSNKSFGNRFLGEIYEIIIFNKNIQLQERRDIFKYLANKYQINVKNI